MQNSAHKKILLCDKSKELAEIMGIIMGDGSVYVHPTKKVYQVHVASNYRSKDEEDYLLNYVKPLFEKTFNITMCIKRAKKCNYVWKQNKDLVYTLNKFGMPAGNKIKNNIKIPKWILANKEYSSLWLRGMFDTDGYLYPRNKAHRFPTMFFYSSVPGIRRSITKVCNIIGLRLSKWRIRKHDHSAPEARISTREDNFKFFKEIGFKNPKHTKRWHIFAEKPR